MRYATSEAQLDLFAFDTPSMPTLDVTRCKARIINHETAARMVETYHYAHRVPSIAVAVGLYVDGALSGCVTYGTIPVSNAGRICGDKYSGRVLELTRLFVFDTAGPNSESWLIGQSYQHVLSRGYDVLLSYADYEYGHIGYIYQALNWTYTGESRHHCYQLENGTVLQSRSAWDPRRGETAQWFFENNPGAHLYHPKPKHRYVYFLGSKRQRKALRKALKWPVLPYPKGDETL